MSGSDSYHFAIESWSLFTLGITVIILRELSQYHRYGFKGLAPEDYIMVLVAGWYTLLVYWSNRCAVVWEGENSDDGLTDLASTESQNYIDGSKWYMIVEQGLINTLYLIKVTMLLLYWRLSFGSRTQIVIKAIALYVAFGWIVNQIAYFVLTCRPFSGNWAVPAPDPQCISWFDYSFVQAVFNISTDFCLLIIPMSLFTRTNYPVKQKLFLCAVFGMGIFVIICAIINKVNIGGNYIEFWNVREVSTAVYVSNLPMIVSLVRLILSKKKKASPKKTPGSTIQYPGLSDATTLTTKDLSKAWSSPVVSYDREPIPNV